MSTATRVPADALAAADGPLDDLLGVALGALRAGVRRRGGPLPAGRPGEPARALAAAVDGTLLP